MGREYTRDASEYGQQLIADAIGKIELSVSTDTTLLVSGVSADAKATGDAIALKADQTDLTALSDNVTTLSNNVNALISDDGITMMLFGKVVTIDANTGVVSLADPVVNDTPSEI